MGEGMGILFISIIVGFVILLIAREVVCWYWKINRAVDSLENIESLLEVLLDQLDNTSGKTKEDAH